MFEKWCSKKLKLSTMNIVHVLIEVCSFWTLSSLCNVLFTLFSNFGLCGLFTLFTKNLIKHHQISSNIIKHLQTSSNIIKHHNTSSNIIKYHWTSSNIIKHHLISSKIIKVVEFNHCCSSCLYLGSLHPRIFIFKVVFSK